MDDMEQAERLANTYADAILRLSYTYLKNTHDAQDICQTVFVKLLMEPREFKSPEHERAYILRMPSLCGRPSDGHTTHRWSDADGNHWVCWDSPVTSLTEMQSVSRLWADSVQEYIATGKRFG